MPIYSFPTNIAVGDLGQVGWANSVSAALNELGPLVDTKADDDEVVKLSGDQTVAGTKTFSSAPVVPDSAFSIAKTSGLQIALNAKAPLASPTFTGTVSGVTKAMVGLGNVDNTSDANKPVSTATQTALNAKAPLASPAFTGTPTGITKAHVGLGNVDNTSDANKPISGDTQTALDAKAPLTSPALTGTPTAPTPATSDNDTSIATTAFVHSAIANDVPSASETVQGRVELATSAETTTGTDTARAVTPAGLKVVADSKVNGNGILNIVPITQAAYDALGTYPSTTFYIITDS